MSRTKLRTKKYINEARLTRNENTSVTYMLCENASLSQSFTPSSLIFTHDDFKSLQIP